MYIYKSIVFNSIITDKLRESVATWHVAVDNKSLSGSAANYSDANDEMHKALAKLQDEVAAQKAKIAAASAEVAVE